jgi:hypothetical protein
VGALKDVEEALEFTARGLAHVSRIYKHSKVHADEVQQSILTKGKLSDLRPLLPVDDSRKVKESKCVRDERQTYDVVVT